MPAKRKSQEYYILTWIPWITKQTVDSLSIEMILDLFIYIIQFYINQNTFLPGFIIRKALTTSHKGFSALAISRVTTISSSLFCICIITRMMLNINLPIYTCILKKFWGLMSFSHWVFIIEIATRYGRWFPLDKSLRLSIPRMEE